MQLAQKSQQNQSDFNNMSKVQLLKLLADERGENVQIESRFTEQSEHLKFVEMKVDEQQECLQHLGNHHQIV